MSSILYEGLPDLLHIPMGMLFGKTDKNELSLYHQQGVDTTLT